jgi:hypothetical protein
MPRMSIGKRNINGFVQILQVNLIANQGAEISGLTEAAPRLQQ